MTLNLSLSYAPTLALSLALSLWPCQVFLFPTTRYGEPLLSGWLFCFTDLDTNFVLLLSLCSIIWALYGLPVYSTLVVLVLAFDLTSPIAFNLSAPTFSSTPTPALFNGALFLHPPILYCSIGYAVLIAYYTTYRQRGAIRPRISTHSSRFQAFGFTLIALVLGGLWAQQELNWGGWWSWDLVEAGTLLIAFFNLLHLHFKNWVYQLPYLPPLVFFFFFFFFEGLRYGLFDSVHSFISLTQVDFMTFTSYYFLGLLALLKTFKYYTRHTMLNWLLGSLTLIGLAFVGDFLHKYYNLPWAWPLNKHLTFIFILFFSFIAKPEPLMFKGALVPYFLNVVSLKVIRVFKGRVIHTAFLSLITGLAISKGVNLSKLGIEFPNESMWVVHKTYLVSALELWEFFPPKGYNLGAINTSYLSLRWGYSTHMTQVNNQLATWQINWVQDFIGYTFLCDLSQITWSLDFSFFLYLFLLKKSRK